MSTIGGLKPCLLLGRASRPSTRPPGVHRTQSCTERGGKRTDGHWAGWGGRVEAYVLLHQEMCSTLAIEVVVSTGQYGHLKRTVRLPRASFWSEAEASTWPHGSSIGGLSGVAGSLETGHAKIE
eukprot:scaffold7099_cov131-Isochrysis_galbana.AAC.8